MEIRLQKILADAGVASRRKSEELIINGRVSVDGKVIRELGMKFDPIKHQVQVDGEAINMNLHKSYIAFNKPKGVVSTMFDPEGRPSLNEYFSENIERLFHVGRLDMESEGLLLLTNDGEFANKLSHPKFGVKKVYYIELQNPIKRNEMERLLKGIKLEDGYSKVDSIEADQSGHLVEVAIHSGKNRILRRLFAEVGHPIERLVRISFGTIKLGELKPGKWRYLNEIELISLQNNK